MKNLIKNNFKYLTGTLNSLQENWPDIKTLMLFYIKIYFLGIKVKFRLFWLTFKETALYIKEHSLPNLIFFFKKKLNKLKTLNLEFHKDLFNRGLLFAYYKKLIYDWYSKLPKNYNEFAEAYKHQIISIRYWGDVVERTFDVVEWLWENLFWLHFLNFLDRDLYYIMDYAKEEWINYKRRRAARWRIRWRFFRKKWLLPLIRRYRLHMYWRYFLFTTSVFASYFMYRFHWLDRFFESFIHYYKKIFAFPRNVFNEIIAENSAFLKEEYIDEGRWAIWPVMWALWCVSLWGYVIWYKHSFYMISPIPIRAFEMMTVMLFDSRMWFIDANKNWWTAFVLATDSEYSYNTPAFNPELKYRGAEFYHCMMRCYPPKMFDVLEDVHHGSNRYRWGSFFYYQSNASLLSFRFVNNFVETFIPNFQKKIHDQQATYIYLEPNDVSNYGVLREEYYLLPLMSREFIREFPETYTWWDYWTRQGTYYEITPEFTKRNFFEYDIWSKNNLINKNSIMGLYTPMEATSALISSGQFGVFLMGSQNIMTPVLANYRMRSNRIFIYYTHMRQSGWRWMLNKQYRSLDFQHYLGITEDNAFFLRWSFKKKQHKMFVSVGHFYKSLFFGETDKSYYAIRNRIQIFYRYRPFYYFPTLAFYYHGEVLFMGCVSAPFIYMAITNAKTAFAWKKIGARYYNLFRETGIKELDNLILLDLYARSYRRSHSFVVILLSLWLIIDYYSNIRTFNYAHGWLLGHINEFKELNAQLGGITDYSDGERLLNLAMTPEFFNLIEVASYFGRNPRLAEDICLYEGTTRRNEDAFLFEYFMPDWYVIKKACACNEISDIKFFSPFWKKKIIGNFNLSGYTIKYPALPLFNLFFNAVDITDDINHYMHEWVRRAGRFERSCKAEAKFQTFFDIIKYFKHYDMLTLHKFGAWCEKSDKFVIGDFNSFKLNKNICFLMKLRALVSTFNFEIDWGLLAYLWRSSYLPRWSQSGALRLDIYKEFFNIVKDPLCTANKWYNIVGLLKQPTMEFYPHLLFDFDSHHSDYQKWVTPKYLVGEGEYYIFNYVKKRNRYLKFYKNMAKRISHTILYLETFARLEYFDLENIHSFKIEHEAARHHFFKKGISQRPRVWIYGKWDERALSFDWAMSKYCDKYYRSGLYHNINRVMMFFICTQNKRLEQWENREIVAPPNCLHEEALWYRFNVLPYFHGIGKRNLDHNRINSVDYDDCYWYEEAGRGKIGQFFQMTKDFKLYTFYPKQHITEGTSYIEYPLFNWMWELYTLSFLRQTLEEESDILEDRIIPKLDRFCIRAWELKNFNHYIGQFGKVLPDIGFQCSVGNILDFRFCQISEVVPSLSKIHISMMDIEHFNTYYRSFSWYQIFYFTKTNGFYWYFLLYKFAVVMIIFMIIFTIVNKFFLHSIWAYNFSRRSPLHAFGIWLYKRKIPEIFANRLTYYMFYWFWFFIIFLIICFYQELINYYYWDKTRFWLLMRAVYYESMHPAWLVREYNNIKALWYIFTKK